MDTRTIRQTVTFRASTNQIYEALLDPGKHAEFTGEKASIDAKVGGRFSCYDGYITGVTVELVPNQRIVQAWRSSDWTPGTYSIVTFDLKASGRVNARLTFTQVGVPAGDYDEKVSGWKTHYWKPLQAMLEKR